MREAETSNSLVLVPGLQLPETIQQAEAEQDGGGGRAIINKEVRWLILYVYWVYLGTVPWIQHTTVELTKNIIPPDRVCFITICSSKCREL